ncbi:response regulator, partial [Bacillus paranthracis]|uniref:response regulator n=1 Tax=Bacillus paranthracis TaxID=2026186 RepID=UPI00284761C3|nr:response regulator [Bacillus paranthracis]
MENESRILIVADEDRIRRLSKMYLEKEQYTIEEADNGVTALEMALQNDYDLI